MGISWDPVEFNHSHSRPASLPFPFPFPGLLNCNPIPMGIPWDSHSHGNPTPMHTSNFPMLRLPRRSSTWAAQTTPHPLTPIITSNQSIVDSRLGPRCRILMNSTKACNCLTSNWYCHLANSSEHNVVVLDSAHRPHGMKT